MSVVRHSQKYAGLAIAVVAVAQLAICAPVCAVDAKDKLKDQRIYTVMGGRSCKQWLKDESDANAISPNANGLPLIGDEGWLVGFLSGVNLMLTGQPDYLANLDLQTAVDWVGEYCKKNPNQDASDAAVGLILKLKNEDKK